MLCNLKALPEKFAQYEILLSALSTVPDSLKDISDNSVRSSELNTLSSSLSSTTDKKFAILETSIDKMIEEKMANKFVELEAMVLRRQQGLVEQAIADFGAPLCARINEFKSILGDETASALKAYSQLLSEHIELSAEIHSVKKDLVLMDHTLRGMTHSYDRGG